MSDMDPLYESMKDSAEDMSKAAVEMKQMMTGDINADVNIEGYGAMPSYAKQVKNRVGEMTRVYTSDEAARTAINEGRIPEGYVVRVIGGPDNNQVLFFTNTGGDLIPLLDTGGVQVSEPTNEVINKAISQLEKMGALITVGADDSFLFLAENGAVARIRSDSTLEIYSVEVSNIIASMLKVSDVKVTTGPYPMAYAADNGYLLILDDTGKLRGIEADFDILKVQGVDVKDLLPAGDTSQGVYPDAPGILAGYIHTACYGQSQNIGTTNGVVHGVPFDSKSLMLNGGLRSYGTGGYDTSVSQANYYISLKPMYEFSAGASYGETYMSGHAIRARTFLDAAYPGLDVKKVYTVSGQGGAAIANLKKGTAAYSRTLAQWVALINLVQSMGEAYRCASMVWSQGGSDDGLATNPDTWEADVRQMRADFTADIKSQTGLHVDPPYITNQINNYMRYPALNGKPNIGIRQYKMVTEEGNNFYGSCPTYILDFIDVAHWTKESQVKVGAYNEKVERNLLLTGGTWKPVHPIKITTSGRFTTAKFHLPEGGSLQFNTDIVNEVPTTFGFSAEQPDGTAIGIDRVRLIASDTVEVRYTETPLSGAVLMYAQTGQVGDPNASNGSGLGRQNGVRGNLCDTAGDNDKIQINGLDYPLHNWCWMFTEDMGVA